MEYDSSQPYMLASLLATPQRTLHAQGIFALIAPGKVVPNLVAGAIAEAGAQQAGDLMQDFKVRTSLLRPLGQETNPSLL